MNRAHTLQMAAPVSLRKSPIVLWSGTSWPVSHIRQSYANQAEFESGPTDPPSRTTRRSCHRTDMLAGGNDCVAGHVGFELRNVVANYRFERPHRFPEIASNSGRRGPLQGGAAPRPRQGAGHRAGGTFPFETARPCD